jgi:hypothetical protein
MVATEKLIYKIIFGSNKLQLFVSTVTKPVPSAGGPLRSAAVASKQQDQNSTSLRSIDDAKKLLREQ